jgi:methylenetetrahydrofolate reductase (NADPH)
MALFGLNTKNSQTSQVSENLESFVCDYSIEVMPRTAEKIENFRDILPKKIHEFILRILREPQLKIWLKLQKDLQRMASPPCPTFQPE